MQSLKPAHGPRADDVIRIVELGVDHELRVGIPTLARCLAHDGRFADFELIGAGGLQRLRELGAGEQVVGAGEERAEGARVPLRIS